MNRSAPVSRWTRRVGVAALSGLALVIGGLAGPGSVASADPLQISPRHGVMPTIEAKARMDAYRAQHPSINAANDLNYGGGIGGIGVTTGPPKVYLVFWGSGWGTSSTNASGDLTFSNDAQGGAPKIQEMFKGLGTNNELWSGVMTYYCEGVATGAQTCPATGVPHVGYPTGGAFAGSGMTTRPSPTPPTTTRSQSRPSPPPGTSATRRPRSSATPST